MSKQYGLILPNKDRGQSIQPVSSVRPSIFDSDSDSEPAKPAKPTGLQKSVKKQQVLTQNKAIEEDPTVYQYDEIYDEMDKKRKESKLSRKDLDRKPKYIGKLLAAADRRKKENERRVERQVQKEREEEGEEFKDKESFVTMAYKKKLEELKILEEQEKREAYLESIGDVRKQGNLDGFYRHLYDQKVLYEDKDDSDKEIKKEPKSDSDSERNKRKSDDSDDDSKKRRKSSESKIKNVAKRKYRTREESESKEEEADEEIQVKKEHLPMNLDADSDFSIDSSDSEEESAKKEDKNEENVPSNEENKEKGNVFSDNAAIAKKNEEKDTNDKEIKEETEEPKPKKPKIDIWKKRTVGEVFDAALQRYFERKALKESSG